MTRDAVRLHFIGSGDAFGNGGRFQTCFWLEAGGDESVMIDCGASSLTALKAAKIEPNEIGTLVLTHLHGDHFGGIPFLVLDGQFRRRERPLTIAGPPGTRARVEAAMEVLFPGSVGAKRRFVLDFRELQPGVVTAVGPANVTTVSVEQPGTPACALRIGFADRVIAYTGDTSWREELIELSRHADLLIAESYYLERVVPYHLGHSEFLAHRHDLLARRIMLTHMSPDMLARQSEAAFECAHDGLVVTI
jgi:ribonuclease BN (tRNA processing enzyme)